MSSVTIRTGTASRTHYYSQGVWEGQAVLVQEGLWDEQGPCPGHELEVMTHFGEATGGLYCPHCCGFTGPVPGVPCDFETDDE